MMRLVHSSSSSSSPTATKPPDSATRRGRRTFARWKASRRASLRRAQSRRRRRQAKKVATKKTAAKSRSKMPLIVVANSPDKEAALAGLERWKARASRRSVASGGRRRPGRFDARPVVYVDAHPRQPAQRSGENQAAAGDARPRRRPNARGVKRAGNAASEY